jgi:hypothetical protein
MTIGKNFYLFLSSTVVFTALTASIYFVIVDHIVVSYTNSEEVTVENRPFIPTELTAQDVP